MKNNSIYKPLDLEKCSILADALGDKPETVISVHLLRRGLCKAYVAGKPTKFDGAIVQWDTVPFEPEGFGSDPEILWDLLKSVNGWDCILVDCECARRLGSIIEEKMKIPVRYLKGIYYTLSKPVLHFQSKFVRQLTLDDLDLLESAPNGFHAGDFGDLRNLLSEGIVACGIISNEFVCMVYTAGRTDLYSEIGAFTLEKWQGQGFASAAASIVAQLIQKDGQTPVWSTGESNPGSIRVAKKLGFTEVLRRTYVILDKK